MSALDNRKNYSCPCCNNPWAAATGEFFAKLCAECDEKEETKEEKADVASKSNGMGISRSNMDKTVLPSDNFYQYANGTWLANNPIPPEYPNWNSFLILHTKSQENLKGILEELREKGVANCTEEEAKVAAFFAAAMDEDRIEQLGVSPLKPLLELVDQTVAAASDKNFDSVAKLLGTLALKYGISAFFGIGVSPDNANTDHSLAQVSQGGIGLPDRDYYFDDDKQDKRDAYKQCVALMLTLLSDPTATEPTDDNIKAAEAIYNLEVELATKHMTKVELRDPHATYNKMSISKFMETTDNKFNYGVYLEAATGKSVDGLGDINIRTVEAMKRVAEAISSVDPATLESYLQWHILKSTAPYLPKAFVQAHFDFYEKALMGTQQIKPRWKRAMTFTESALGEALGKLYCARYFDDASKQHALKIVEQVRQSLEDRLKEVEWMKADSTREQALKKMGEFKVKIGYPDKWTDYSTLSINPEKSFLEMVLAARQFDRLEDVKEMNAPTDRAKWFMTPQTINAYYHPNLNEIVFPAAILQPPFFDKDVDDAVNFGAMGAVIGHEMTHGFDDKGRKFDFAGTLTDWWTPDDATEYETRVEVMVEQANQYEVHGQKVQGKLTSGENIADLGGLRLALRALKATPEYDATKLVDGFTPMQRFFLSWATCWRQNITQERSLQLLTIDPHGPNEMRCNGPLSNMPEFHQEFDVQETDSMYLPKEKRVDIW